MTEKRIDVKEVTLKNNCPVCYGNEGLRLNFQQKIVETTFYKSITSEITQELSCGKCHSVIYPVQWTSDIERVVEYQKRALTPKKQLTYLKKASWVVIISSAIVLATIVFTIVYSNL